MTPSEQIELQLHMGARQYQLSPREVEVFVHMTRGRTTHKDIGVAMGIQETTVENHLRMSFTKTQTNDKTAALVRLLGLGTHDVPA